MGFIHLAPLRDNTGLQIILCASLQFRAGISGGQKWSTGEGPSQGKYTRQKASQAVQDLARCTGSFLWKCNPKTNGVSCWSQAKGALQQSDVHSASLSPVRSWQSWAQLKSVSSSEIFSMQRVRMRDKNMVAICDSFLAFLPTCSKSLKVSN